MRKYCFQPVVECSPHKKLENPVSVNPNILSNPLIYNLAVIMWHENDWEGVVNMLSMVMSIDPGNVSASKFLEQAKASLALTRQSLTRQAK